MGKDGRRNLPDEFVTEICYPVEKNTLEYSEKKSIMNWNRKRIERFFQFSAAARVSEKSQGAA